MAEPNTTASETAWLRRSEEHTSELQSPCNLVCRLLLEKKKTRLANTPRDAIEFLDTLELLRALYLPLTTVRRQLSCGVYIFCEVGSSRYGSRRVSSVTA